LAHQVAWTKVIVDAFIEEAMLSHDEAVIIRTRAAGWSRVKQAQELHMSVANIDKIIKRLKVKYDKAQSTSQVLPPRRFSNKEVYTDDL